MVLGGTSEIGSRSLWGLIIGWVLGLQFEWLGFVGIGDHEIVGFVDLMFNFVLLFSKLFVIFGF